MKRWLSIMALLLAVPAQADVSPVVRVTVSPEEVAVGEPVTVSVTVLCPTFFPKPPRFSTGELANAITRLPPRGSRPTQQRVDGESWSGVVYDYQVYPLLGATYSLSGETVAVTCAEPGTIKGPTVDVVMDEVVFRAVVPVGAESLEPYLAGRSLTLERILEGEPESLEAGDALVVSYVAELDGLPAMFLPKLVEVPETPGVSFYPDQPIVEDHEPARRTERYTFVFESGGEFIIPGASLGWWNKETGQVETAAVKPMSVSVVGDPLPVPEEEVRPPEPIDWRRILIGLLLLYGAWKLFTRLRPRLQAALAAARKRRLESEEHAFKQLEKALLVSDRRRAQSSLLAWLDRIAPGSSPREFAARYGDEKLSTELERISKMLYRDGSDRVHMKRLLPQLSKARRRVRQERQRSSKLALPPLNP